MDESLPLFSFYGDRLPRFRARRSARQFLRYVLLNPFNREILCRLPELGLAECWLTSGCLLQTIWNVRCGRRPSQDIQDYDVFYFDRDLSWESENAVIERARDLFADLPVKVEVRNQARVHLWYSEKFGIPYAPVRAARHALRRFPCGSTAIGVSLDAEMSYIFYAPFGFRDALAMIVRPNRQLAIPFVYESKVARWQRHWPSLVVKPW